jgi:hypothetical protein
VRDYSAHGLSAADLERARRELSASLALTRPGSPMRAPIKSQLGAIDVALAERASAVLRVCGCGMASDSDARMNGHLWNNPDHQERDLSRYQDVAIVVADRG